MTAHLGYEKHAPEGRNRGNSRNGMSTKRLKTETGELGLKIPRDREGSFDPVLVPKGQRRLPGFDEKVIALYARGRTTREIQGHLKEIYKVEVSPSLISSVTDAVLDDVKAWQARPLDAVYPIVYLDAIHVKMRTGGHVQTQAVYLALALTLGPMMLGHTGVNYASGMCGPTWRNWPYSGSQWEPPSSHGCSRPSPNAPPSSTLVGGGLILLGIAVASKRGPARDSVQEGEREEGQPGPDPDGPAFGWWDESGDGSGEGRG